MDDSDSFYKEYNQKCMNFVRMAVGTEFSNPHGTSPLSKVTHYIDGSAIYGSDSASQHELRSFQNGLLKSFLDTHREMLPLSSQSQKSDCIGTNSVCFKAGDTRANSHITLLIIHMLFLREHNRIAKVLNFMNPHWTDETVYQETRKIVIAELQHITYNEWLPLIIGNAAGHLIQSLGYSNNYDEAVNPSISSEFAGAAFRFGHSTVQGTL